MTAGAPRIFSWGIILLFAGLFSQWPTPASAEEIAPLPMKAMWVYETNEILGSAAARSELVQFCKTRQITDLFFQVHFENDVKSGQSRLRDEDKWPSVLQEAATAKLRIHALFGEPEHALTKNHEKVLARVDALAAFNARVGTTSGQFAGLHLDVEPHGLGAWKKADDAEKSRLLTQLVELNAKVVEHLHAKAPGMLYGADITFWFDKTKPDGTPAYPVTFRGVTKDATKHLLDMVDNVAVMGYRDSAGGSNGLIAINQRAVTYADTAKGRVFVGVKMANIGPNTESFFGRSEPEMLTELRKVDDAYGPHRGYAGIAFFMYSAYRKMPGAK
jgi:hypothetical protein